METFKFSHKVEQRQMISLSVYNVGRQKCDPGYTWGPGVRDHYLIHYIKSGSGVYETGGRRFELSQGDLFLAYPDTEIRYRASDEDPWTYEWVGFSGSDAPSLLQHTDLTAESPVLMNLPYGQDFQQQLSRINDAFGNSLTSALQMTGELYLLLAILIDHASPSSGTAGAPEHENVRRAVEYITARYSYSITVEDIADYIGVSRSTLFRQFRKVEQLSPKEYLDRYRIQRSAHLLETTGLTIESVAQSVGYDNGLYFSKVFRRYMNETPSGYRKRMQNTDGT